ncbi:Signal transduction histidine kinase [Friedmanniella luteola]|uniref:Signal transduction histidine kinase n=1 Tax=Friedmanniella luteola TaxID=546871 RepID=A0A1H1YP58_9ACTN|nr:GAF domain-containing protein [Friedmanniella luteola]SDT22896.1 Signal transduction histidine kinase [Friedmanniella luteola]
MLDAAAGTHDSSAARLQKLVEANHAIVAELTLDDLLRRVVRSAREVAGAQYAALGVFSVEGLLEQFIHCGMDDQTVAAIGELPKGRGLIGALLDHPEPIRLPAVADDHRSAGVPEGHPPMGAFLGVPIRSASTAYGNLYLANGVGRPEFSPEDQNLVTALAATASIAIENARLHGQSQRRQDWLRASAQVSHRLLASADEGPVLAEIAGSVRRLTEADAVAILLPAPDDPGQLVMEVVDGLGAEGLKGLRVDLQGSQVQQVLVEERGRVLAGFQQRIDAIAELRSLPPLRHVVALPLQGAGRRRGAIIAVRMGDVPFSPTDLELAEGFVSQAGLALELADARSDHHKLAMLEDRARIARELHDHVVQKLFAAGLTLQGTATMVGDPDLRRRLTGAIDNLDDTIRTIRTSIFELQEPNLPGASVRGRVMQVLGEMTPVLGFAPLLSFEGPLDTVVDEQLGSEVEAVLRESLTNAAKHAGATAVTVDLVTTGRTLTMTVSDDGVGLRPSARRSGLSNLRFRAERRGGRLELDRGPAGGLLLRWSIPLPG